MKPKSVLDRDGVINGAGSLCHTRLGYTSGLLLWLQWLLLGWYRGVVCCIWVDDYSVRHGGYCWRWGRHTRDLMHKNQQNNNENRKK